MCLSSVSGEKVKSTNYNTCSYTENKSDIFQKSKQTNVRPNERKEVRRFLKRTYLNSYGITNFKCSNLH